jgi:hypothetical protein
MPTALLTDPAAILQSDESETPVRPGDQVDRVEMRGVRSDLHLVGSFTSEQNFDAHADSLLNQWRM